jgi:predicted nucleic acid-binding protein
MRITRSIVTQAGLVLERHPLRAYDAVQLACALAVQRLMHQQGMPPPLFVTADEALLVAARAEGFPVANPLQYP